MCTDPRTKKTKMQQFQVFPDNIFFQNADILISTVKSIKNVKFLG